MDKIKEENEVVIIIGHNRVNKGAYSIHLNDFEYTYHKKVIEELEKRKVKFRLLEREPNKTYGKQMREVLVKLDSKKYKLALELHFNSVVNERVKGATVLYYYKNRKAKDYIQMYFDSIIKIKPTQTFKPLIPIKDIWSRGAYGIMKSKGTYLLLEPFFAGNKDNIMSVEEYADILEDFIKKVYEK